VRLRAGPASPTATDNCDDNVQIDYDEVRTNGPCSDSYTLTRTWTATDDCGNQTVETQTITVLDTTPPVLIGVPDDVTAECDSVPQPPTVTASDNCDDDVPVQYQETRTDAPAPTATP